MQNQEFRLPYHGSYIYDIRFEGNPKLERIMTFHDNEGKELENRKPLDTILPLVSRAYPQVGFYDMSHYGNKNFIVIGTKNYGQKVMVLYRHDFSWMIIEIPRQAFLQYQKDNPYYSPVQWDNMPEY
jgi:hypothetical protein